VGEEFVLAKRGNPDDPLNPLLQRRETRVSRAAQGLYREALKIPPQGSTSSTREATTSSFYPGDSRDRRPQEIKSTEVMKAGID
jgi:hypothetical protein